MKISDQDKADHLVAEAWSQFAAGNTVAAAKLVAAALRFVPEHAAAGALLKRLEAGTDNTTTVSQAALRLSVIIPTCNRSTVLAQCLAHLEAQTLPPQKFEVLVIDDGSQDATVDFLEKYHPPFAFRYFVQPRRGGPAQARNTGIRAARGDIVLFLNDDALLTADGLRVHLETHDLVPDTDFSVLGRFDLPADFSRTPWGYLLSHSDIVFDYDVLENGKVYGYNYYYTCNVSTSRRALLAAGLFDEDFTGVLWGAEDIELGIRLMEAGIPVVYRTGCEAVHNHNLSVDDFPRMFRVRGGGAVRIFAKHPDLPIHYKNITKANIQFWRNLPSRVLERIQSLYAKLRAVDAYPLAMDDTAPIKLHEERLGPILPAYKALWKLYTRELLTLLAPLETQLDDLLRDLAAGTCSMQQVAKRLFPVGTFLRWFHDTEGVCASDWIFSFTPTSPSVPLERVSEAMPAAFSEGGKGALGPVEVRPAAPRILLACDFFWPSVGGTELFVEELGVRLLDAGYAVDVACRHLDARGSLTHRGLRLHPFHCQDRFFDPTMGQDIGRYRSLVCSGGYQAVVTLAHPDTWVCHSLVDLPTGTGAKPRLIMMPSMNAANVREWEERGVLATVRTVLAAATQHVAVSENGMDAVMLRELGLPYTFIPHAVTRQAHPQAFRERYALPDATPLLACVGNFWPVKNQLSLLRTLCGAPGDWRLVLAGAALPWTSERAYFNACWDTARKDPRMRITGPLPPAEAAALIRDADLLLVPSLGESAGPLVALQAMAFGVPWLATPECNAVRDEAGGLAAPLGQFPKLIAALLAQPESRRELGALGQEHWRRCFTWERSLPLFIDLVEGRTPASDLTMPEALRLSGQVLARRIFEAAAESAS